MALRWIEGFDWLGSTGMTGAALQAELQEKYTQADMTNFSPTSTTGVGRGGGVALEWGISSAQHFTKALDNQSAWIVGFALRTHSSAHAQRSILQFWDAGAVQCALQVTTGGNLAFYRGLASLNLGTSAFALALNQWYYIEVKVTIHSTAGAVEVRVNGSPVLTVVGVDTQQFANSFANQIDFSSGNTGTRIDDIYICDASGTQNTDFLGEVKVERLVPTGDSGLQGWTPSDGTSHFALVDETPDNADADYLESANVPGNQDLFDYANLASLDSGIRGVQVNTLARVTDAGSIGIKTLATSGAAESEDVAQVVSDTSYRSFARVIESDPNTGALWTAASVNAAQFGIKVG